MYRDHRLDVLWSVYKVFNVSVIFIDLIAIATSILICCAMFMRRREFYKTFRFRDSEICTSARAPVVVAAVLFAFLVYLFTVFVRGHGVTEFAVLNYGFITVALNFVLRSSVSILLYVCIVVGVLGYACHLDRTESSENHDNE